MKKFIVKKTIEIDNDNYFKKNIFEIKERYFIFYFHFTYCKTKKEVKKVLKYLSYKNVIL